MQFPFKTCHTTEMTLKKEVKGAYHERGVRKWVIQVGEGESKGKESKPKPAWRTTNVPCPVSRSRCVVILGCPAHNHDGHVAAKNNCLPRHRDGAIDPQRDTVGRDRFVMGNVCIYAILV